MRLSELRAEVEGWGLFWPDQMRGCSPEDIEGVERALGLTLPAAFREFLAWIGRGAGQFMRGTDWGFEALTSTEVSEASRALLEEAGRPVPADAVFFLLHQGYVCGFLRASEGDDPPVYTYCEGDADVGRVDSFTEFLRIELDAYVQDATLWMITGNESADTPPVRPDLVRAFADCSPRGLTAVPPVVLTLENLQTLDLRGKGLRAVPEEIGRLVKLRLVNLNMNALESFPVGMVGRPSLATLHLSANRIRRLPETFGDMPSLRELYLDGNPLEPGEVDRAARLLPAVRIVTD